LGLIKIDVEENAMLFEASYAFEKCEIFRKYVKIDENKTKIRIVLVLYLRNPL